jgi:pyridoxamine 5'-phosphate oxidase
MRCCNPLTAAANGDSTISESRSPFHMRKKEGKWSTLDGVLKAIWAMLDRGATHYRDPFHWPVLGTSGKDGVRLRCVILRDFLMPDRVLVCHTDARAAKVEEISNAAKVSWLFYHPKRKVQLRISGHACLHADDPFADRQWAGTGVSSRLNYCAIQPPGTPIDSPSSGLPDFLLNKAPTLLETEKGRQHFTAISCRIDSIDWLLLRVLGNRRARFEWDESGLNAKWLIP